MNNTVLAAVNSIRSYRPAAARNTPAVEPVITANLLERFVSYIDAAPKTVETYTRALRQMLRYFESEGISRPQRADIVAYRDSLKSSGRKATTIQSYMTAARLFFRWAEQEGLYTDVADRVKSAKVDSGHRKDYLTSKQINDVLAGIDRGTLRGKRDYAVLLLAVTAGLRTVEIARASTGDMRTIGDAIVLFVQGKGHDEKNEIVKLPHQTARAVREYLNARGHIAADAPLFVSCSRNNSGGRLTTRTISGIVKSALRAAGYDDERLTAHSMRHTAVTLSILAGKPLDEVRQFARHKSISTTMIYYHEQDKMKNTCADAVAAAIFAC